MKTTVVIFSLSGSLHFASSIIGAMMNFTGSYLWTNWLLSYFSLAIIQKSQMASTNQPPRVLPNHLDHQDLPRIAFTLERSKLVADSFESILGPRLDHHEMCFWPCMHSRPIIIDLHWTTTNRY